MIPIGSLFVSWKILFDPLKYLSSFRPRSQRDTVAALSAANTSERRFITQISDVTVLPQNKA
jgi:hypothetical protein